MDRVCWCGDIVEGEQDLCRWHSREQDADDAYDTLIDFELELL
jgi:hypothetical protein